MKQLSGKGNNSSSKTKSGSGSITVECTRSWRARSNIFFLSVWAGGILQSCDLISIASGKYCSIRSAHSGRYPVLCMLSPLVHLLHLVAFRSRHLSDKWLINSLSICLKSLRILLKIGFEFCDGKLWVIKWVDTRPRNRL